jgi:hypothetical protein
MMIESRSSRGFGIGGKSSCGVKVIFSSRSMVDRRLINKRSVKRMTSRMQKQRGTEREELRQ